MYTVTLYERRPPPRRGCRRIGSPEAPKRNRQRLRRRRSPALGSTPTPTREGRRCASGTRDSSGALVLWVNPPFPATSRLRAFAGTEIGLPARADARGWLARRVSAMFRFCQHRMPAGGTAAERRLPMRGGKGRVGLRTKAGASPWRRVILVSKFTKNAPDSMNFVNFAGKSLCFQPSGRVSRPALDRPPDRLRPVRAVGVEGAPGLGRGLAHRAAAAAGSRAVTGMAARRGRKRKVCPSGPGRQGLTGPSSSSAKSSRAATTITTKPRTAHRVARRLR